jgi:hypothetical protein
MHPGAVNSEISIISPRALARISNSKTEPAGFPRARLVAPPSASNGDLAHIVVQGAVLEFSVEEAPMLA